FVAQVANGFYKFYTEAGRVGWVIFGIHNDRVYGPNADREKVELFLKAFSDKRRLDFLLLLKQRPHYGLEIATALGITPAAVKYHSNFLFFLDLLDVERVDHRLLLSGTLFAAVIVVTDALVHFLNTYLSGMLEIKSTSKLQISMLARLLNVQMKDLDRYHSADLISRVNDSAKAAQQGINQKTIELISNLLQIAFLLTYLLTLQYALTLGTIIICSLVPLVMLPFTSRLRMMNEQRQSIESAQQAFIQDTVQGAEVVRAFSLAPRLLKQFNLRIRQYFKVHLPVSRVEAVGYNMPLAVILGGLLYVLSYGGYLVILGRLDVGAVAAFLICFEQISNP
ncbi:hypothetical protein KC345_g11561, partial [Hortaea werneckii]